MEPSQPALSPESLLSSAGFVQSVARGLLRDPHSADDVAQEALLAAMERPPRSEHGLRGWLAAVVRSIARGNARGEDRRKRRESEAARAESTPSTTEILERESLRATVVQAVLALAEPSRSAVLLRYYEDKTPREIARRLGVPVETVRTRIKRGLAELRRELDGRFAREEGGTPRALLALAGAGRASLALWPVAAGIGALLLAAGGLAFVVRSRNETGVAEASVALVPTPSADPGSSPAQLASESPRPERAVTSPATDERVLSGRVADARGRPLAGAILYVSPDEPPPAKFHYHPEWVAYLEHEKKRVSFVETDHAGVFRATFADYSRVHAAVVEAKDPFLWADPQHGRWLDLPASDVVFRVKDAPTAEVSVTVRVEESGEPLLAFTCVPWRLGDRAVLAGVPAEAGRALCKLPFRPPVVPDEFQLSIADARHGRAFTQLRLEPGERRDVELVFPARVALSGQVVDPTGAPIEGALVCSGTDIRLRGDEPFKPYDPARVKDGVLTDAAGWFTLEGSARHVTVWHADWSPRTVKSSAAALVRLEPRSSLRGRLLASDGSPASGVVVLDKKLGCPTDERGRFAFEKVEAGVRGLRLPDKRLVSVIVRPGETIELELGAENRLDVALELLRGGALCLDEIRGAGVGLDPVSEVFEFRAEGGAVPLSLALPGRYVLLSTRCAPVVADLTRASATVELGTTPLTVSATPGTRVYLVPAGASELVELMAGRVSSRTVDATGMLEVPGVAPGRYGVGIDREGVQVEIEVGTEPLEIRLD